MSMEASRPLSPAAPSAVSLAFVEKIVGSIPGVLFSTKDCTLKFVGANDNMLKVCGVQAREEIVGRSSEDFFVKDAGALYEKHDRYVIRTGRPLQDRLDLTMPTRGRSLWVLISRWPIVDGAGLSGVAVVARPLASGAKLNRMYERVFRVVRHVEAHLDETHDVPQMAVLAGVQCKRLERDFIRIFGVPPGKYLTRLRMEEAIGLLATSLHIADVAQACGYADQSAFTRRFRAIVGMAPSEFRQRLLFPRAAAHARA